MRKAFAPTGHRELHGWSAASCVRWPSPAAVFGLASRPTNVSVRGRTEDSITAEKNMYRSKFSVEFGLRPNSAHKWANSAIPANRPTSTPRISSFFFSPNRHLSLASRRRPLDAFAASPPSSVARCVPASPPPSAAWPPRLPPALRGSPASCQGCAVAPRRRRNRPEPMV